MEEFTAERATDRVLHVEFYMDAMQNNFKSEKEGHPVFDDVEMVRIIVPGDTKTMIETRVDETHKFRFKDHYRRFKQGLTDTVSGWPLKEWPIITASQVKLFNYHNVLTVEQLAGISDQACNIIGMGAMDLRTKAKAALAAANGTAEQTSNALALERQNAVIASLQAQLKELNDKALGTSQVASQVASPEKRGRGRPSKVVVGTSAESLEAA